MNNDDHKEKSEGRSSGDVSRWVDGLGWMKKDETDSDSSSGF